MEKPLFSVVVIARNERQTLPRLLGSLKEFIERGGDVQVMDTGSTDGTVRWAEDTGLCQVHEATYTRRIGMVEATAINMQFRKGEDPEIVKPEDTYFDFSAARNNAADFALNDWVAMPDCDEIYTNLDIDKINEAIRSGVDQFEYQFVYSHNADGTPQVQFRHCKFYNKRKLLWTGVIHEVLTPVGVSPEVIANQKIRREYVDYIKLEHFQNPSTNRGQYLVGLAVDCFHNKNNDRNAHYFARELMYTGRNHSAKSAFMRHIAMERWPAERAQSMVYMGDLTQNLTWYFRAWECDGGRREPLIKIAEHYYKEKDALKCATFAKAALEIPLNDYYGNQLHHYGAYPHEMLYWAYWNLGKQGDAGYHWGMARRYAPLNSKFLHDSRFFNKLPKVSIIIPHVSHTRHEQLERLLSLIKKNANYPEEAIEVIVEEDRRPCVGCPVTFNHGVERATGELIMFLGDDCEPQPDFLIHAVQSHLQFKWDHNAQTALTALNDGVWAGKLATHWLADKDFKWTLPTGVFLNEDYNHVGCDNELTAWAKKHKRFNYAEHSLITHRVVDDEVHRAAWDTNLVSQDRALLLQRCEQYGLDKKDAMCDGLAPSQ